MAHRRCRYFNGSEEIEISQIFGEDGVELQRGQDKPAAITAWQGFDAIAQVTNRRPATTGSDGQAPSSWRSTALVKSIGTYRAPSRAAPFVDWRQWRRAIIGEYMK